jgi:cell wall-associated NlpC family hydrolase
MMTEETAQRLAVQSEALSWLKTPFHHGARIKGAGVDCAQLLIGVYSGCGLIPPIDTGPYPPDWHMHREEERFLGWVQKYAHKVDQGRLGDMALYRFGRCFSHGAIIIAADDHAGLLLLHAYVGRGVIISRDRDEPLGRRAVQFWSLWP